MPDKGNLVSVSAYRDKPLLTSRGNLSPLTDSVVYISAELAVVVTGDLSIPGTITICKNTSSTQFSEMPWSQMTTFV